MHKTIARKINIIQHTILKVPNLFNLMLCVAIGVLAMRTYVVDETAPSSVETYGSCSHGTL